MLVCDVKETQRERERAPLGPQAAVSSYRSAQRLCTIHQGGEHLRRVSPQGRNTLCPLHLSQAWPSACLCTVENS